MHTHSNTSAVLTDPWRQINRVVHECYVKLFVLNVILYKIDGMFVKSDGGGRGRCKNPFLFYGCLVLHQEGKLLQIDLTSSPVCNLPPYNQKLKITTSWSRMPDSWWFNSTWYPYPFLCMQQAWSCYLSASSTQTTWYEIVTYYTIKTTS